MSLPYCLSYLQAHPGYKNRTNIFFSQFFLEAADIPEYDFDTDELIYRGHNGNKRTVWDRGRVYGHSARAKGFHWLIADVSTVRSICDDNANPQPDLPVLGCG